MYEANRDNKLHISGLYSIIKKKCEEKIQVKRKFHTKMKIRTLNIEYGANFYKS